MPAHYLYGMDIDTYTKALNKAKADLAFALAQGDGYAEDEADARLKALEELGRESWEGGVQLLSECEQVGRHVCGPQQETTCWYHAQH